MSGYVPFGVPQDAALGTIWAPDTPDQDDGPMADDVREFATGLVRVEKVCTACGREHQGWIFQVWYMALERKGLEAPYVLGRYGRCDECVGQWEVDTKIRHLEYQLDRLRAKWEAATTIPKRLPIGRMMVRSLNELLEIAPPVKRAMFEAQRQAMRNWVTDQEADRP